MAGRVAPMSDQRSWWLPAGFLLACVVIGMSVGASAFAPVAVIAGVALVVVAIDRPVLRSVAVLLASSTLVFVWAAPHVTVADIDLYLGEGLLVVAVIATALDVRRTAESLDIFRDPISIWVGLYVAASIVGVAVGLDRETPFSSVASGFRPQVFALSYFVFRFTMRSPESRRLLGRWIAVVAVGVAVMQSLQVALGSGVMLFAVGSYTDLIETDAATGLLRVRPPGLYLEYVVACMSVAYLVWGPRRGRVWVLGVSVATVCGVALSLNRNMLVGLVAGLCVAGAISLKKRRAAAVGLSVVAIAIVVGVYAGGAGLGGPVVERFASLADPTVRSAALQDRQYETALAVAAALTSPVVGIGWGTEYGASAIRVFEGIVAQRNRDWVHNQYVAAWLRMGLLGLLSLLAIIATTMIAATRVVRLGASEELGWLGLATVAAMTSLAISATVDLVILNPSNVPVFMLVAACGSVLWAQIRLSSGGVPR
jgi:O-antigen ligase